MLKQHFKPLGSPINSALVDMPVPLGVSWMWNFGILIGISLMVQIASGFFLACCYENSSLLAFFSVVHIMDDVNSGNLIRAIHANGASLYFIFMYIHMGRGLYFGSYRYYETWMAGVTLMLLSMAVAFVGYVLPWGQMSFWGATVITGLVGAVPYVGTSVVEWLWGGFSVDSVTLTRFFSFHFILPFVILGVTIVHIIFLHESGSNSPLGSKSQTKFLFGPIFLEKDLVAVFILLLMQLFLSLCYVDLLGDSENFNWANPLVTPLHIQPEWYYLFAYCILRAIPNKLGGVIGLVSAVVVYYLLPFSVAFKTKSTSNFFFSSFFFFWCLSLVLIGLTWIGANPVQEPFILTGQILTFIYFFLFLGVPLLENTLK